MTTSSWRTSLVVQALDESAGCAVPVGVGLLETPAGGVQVALRVGDDRLVILPLETAGRLELKVREVLAERFRLTVGKLGGERS